MSDPMNCARAPDEDDRPQQEPQGNIGDGKYESGTLLAEMLADETGRNRRCDEHQQVEDGEPRSPFRLRVPFHHHLPFTCALHACNQITQTTRPSASTITTNKLRHILFMM